MEKQLKFSVHFSFAIFAGVLVYFGKGFLFANYLFAIVVHEFAHAFVARRLGYSIKNIKLIPFGICLNLHAFSMKESDEIKIALAGPFVNFCISLFLFALWWIAPSTFEATHVFCYANIVTCVFNMLPAFPLDGGRVVRAVLKQNCGETEAIKICKIINIFICFVLGFLFALSFASQPNFTFLLVMICILSGVSNKNNLQVYSFINYSSQKKNKKIVKIKNIYVQEDEKLFRACKFVDSFSFLNLYVYNKSNILQTILDEKEFFALLDKFSSSTTFGEAIKNLA